MTETQNRPSGAEFFNALSVFLQQAMGVLARLMIGVLIILIAGLVALMTALIGLMVAGAAVVMRFAGPRMMAKARATQPADTITLEARRTPRGWTAE